MTDSEGLEIPNAWTAFLNIFFAQDWATIYCGPNVLVNTL